MSKLLMDEKPLIVMPSLATKIGLNESIFLQQLHYWLDKSTNVKEGYRWVYNTAKEWQKQFPFWSVNTIRRVINSLKVQELVVIDNFNSLPIDKTSWYRINYVKVAELEGENTDSEKIDSTTQSEHSKYSERVIEAPKLGTPLPESTTEITTEINNNNNDNAGTPPENPFSFFQNNGFGILTPYVGEKIGASIDDLNEELVIHAMKVSLENSVPRWSYAESILRDWQNKKITSLDQVLAAEKQREQQKKKTGNKSFARAQREEIVPDWFNKDKPKKSEPTPVDNIDIAEKRRKLKESMDKKKREMERDV